MFGRGRQQTLHVQTSRGHFPSTWIEFLGLRKPITPSCRPRLRRRDPLFPSSCSLLLLARFSNAPCCRRGDFTLRNGAGWLNVRQAAPVSAPADLLFQLARCPFQTCRAPFQTPRRRQPLKGARVRAHTMNGGRTCSSSAASMRSCGTALLRRLAEPPAAISCACAASLVAPGTNRRAARSLSSLVSRFRMFFPLILAPRTDQSCQSCAAPFKKSVAQPLSSPLLRPFSSTSSGSRWPSSCSKLARRQTTTTGLCSLDALPLLARLKPATTSRNRQR